MIEPVLMGTDLVHAMRAPVAGGTVAVWPLGQSGMCLRFPSVTVYVDLYLSNHCEAVLPRPFDHRRLSRAPLDAAEVADADVVICSHDHLDHLDPPTLRSLKDSSPRAVAIAPRAAAPTLRSLDWPDSRVIITDAGDSLHVSGLSVTSFAVAHDEYDHDAMTGFPYQGYIISDGTVSIAHVGDARSDPELAATLAALRPNAVCLPINGRDGRRAAMGFAGNMNATEALDLLRDAGTRNVVPMHFDMFAQNTDPGAAELFLRAATEEPAIRAHCPRIGECAVITSDET